MPTVDLQKALNVPAVPAREALSNILNDIVAGRDKWQDFALYLNLRDAGLPDVGYVAIPIDLRVIEERLEPRHEIRFTFQAKRSPQAFPTFEGSMGVDPNGPSSAALWLGGSYELPMRGFGTLVDAVLGKRAADKTLDNMLVELAAAVVARVEKRELAGARYRVFFNSGD